ncbi:MAG: TetR/AcrR family transcriptional regulator [Oscillospiraceae bacterium]|nr:TetR/AcrR family transcriptional regulator [Oscillospiraceae bacterium]
MGHDKETREKLIESAKAEFMEKGYNKASLRSICANAGVTTGALYFFFKDKADLFKAIVGKPVDGLFEIMQAHFDEDEDIVAGADQDGAPDDYFDDHSEMAQLLIHHIYSNYDAAILVLTKAQGSEYEDIVDQIVGVTENKSIEMMDKLSAKTGKKQKVNKYMLHLVIHLVVDSFVHLVTHETDEQKALANIKKVFKMTMHNWTDTVLD